MTNIAIAGTGISGLTLALRLQQLGVETVIYTDKDPDQLRAAPPDEPGGPLRAHPGPRARTWASTTGTSRTSLCGVAICRWSGPRSAFRGDLTGPARFVDFRILPGPTARGLRSNGAAGWSSGPGRSPRPWSGRASTPSSSSPAVGRAATCSPAIRSRSPYDRPSAGAVRRDLPGDRLPGTAGSRLQHLARAWARCSRARSSPSAAGSAASSSRASRAGRSSPWSTSATRTTRTAFEATVLELFRVHAPADLRAGGPSRVRADPPHRPPPRAPSRRRSATGGPGWTPARTPSPSATRGS